MRIWVAVEPVDFRKGIDGLAGLCRQQLQADPMDGALFVFRSRNGRALKCLVYDSQGFWLCQKRLSSGRFTAWPRGEGAARSARLPKGHLRRRSCSNECLLFRANEW